MGYVHPESLVDTAWLAERLDDPKISVVDGSWHMPAMKRDPAAEFLERHIPGAVFFDVDAISDPDSDLPHMMPSEELFAAKVGELGISSDDHVVVYDTNGLSSAARAWWMMRAFGHDKVSVLDGGLPKWMAEGRPVESGAVHPRPAAFRAKLNRNLLVTVDDVRANIDSRRADVLDARSAGRFRGTEAEPRAGLRGGHIPGSFSLPYTELLNPADKTVRDADALDAAFDKSGIGRDRPVITSCGSGITACVLALGLHLVGRKDVAVYDGSWTEWGGRSDTPIET
ncbi:MAG: 3-mercaptopyruvate sulfurtransferase [Rhodospirillaceae bacterium]|nr:3-mercaptopyruvate sulfurtransferase [Rhodospirillaceae bacterium]